MHTHRSRKRGVGIAVLVVVAMALAIAPAGAGAAAADSGLTQPDGVTAPTLSPTDDDLTNDTLQTNSSSEDGTVTNGSTTVTSTDSSTNDSTLDGATNDSTISDADTNDSILDEPTNDSTLDDVTNGTDGSLSVDAGTSLAVDNETTLDASLNATTNATDDVALTLEAATEALSVASVNGSLSIGDEIANDSASDAPNGSDGGHAADGAAEDGGDGGSNGLDASGAGAGAAVGSLLVGGGLLARRFAETSAATGGVGGGSGGSLVSVAVAWLRTWGWRLLAILGYQRLDSSDPLEHETRAGIYERIEDEPGVFLTELSETTDVPMSTLRYHLRILEFEDLIVSEKVRGKRRYVPAEAEGDALGPALEDDATAAVLAAVAKEPDSVSGLADRLDRTPGTVTHHLQRLDDEGLVEREREGRSVVTRLADEVDPTDVVGASAGHAD